MKFNVFNSFHSNRELNLRQPIYQQTSCYGHFGRDCFPWEQAKTLQLDWLNNNAEAISDNSIVAKKAKRSLDQTKTDES